jgi:hypothetical protein
MEIIWVNKLKYVQASSIIEKAPIFCKGIRNGRELINKKLAASEETPIKGNEWIYARLNNDEWNISDGISPKFDKVLIRYKYIVTVQELIDEINDEGVATNNGVREAPSIIDLEDHEKFHDDQGNIVEIETRGERNCRNIFFRVNDVVIGFETNSLKTNLINAHTNYERVVDYEYFMCKRERSTKGTQNNIKVVKELFLTYIGMLKVIFISRTGRTKKFTNWVTETLFTTQLGTNSQKRELASNILGIDAATIKELSNTNARNIPCIYLFTLGTAKNLRNTFGIDPKYTDDMIICKFGFAKNLHQRTGQHMRGYGRMNNVELRLKIYSYIDPLYISEAESFVKLLMKKINVRLEYENHKELIIVSRSAFKLIKSEYQDLGKKYAGHVSELVGRIKDLENDIKLLNTELEKHRLESKLTIQKLESELMRQKLEDELAKQRLENEMMQQKMDNKLSLQKEKKKKEYTKKRNNCVDI